MMRVVAAFAVTLFAAAPGYAQAPALQLTARPQAGVEAEVEIGQAAISVTLAPAQLRVMEPVTASVTGNRVELPAGPYFSIASTSKGEYFQSAVAPRLGAFGLMGAHPAAGVFIPADPTAEPRAYWENAYGMRATGKAPGLRIERHVEPTELGQGFRRELIYSGIAQGTVRLTYREFLSDMARPAFTQELSYDLAAGDEIGFRGARLKVLKATNVALRYQVLKPLDAPADGR